MQLTYDDGAVPILRVAGLLTDATLIAVRGADGVLRLSEVGAGGGNPAVAFGAPFTELDLSGLTGPGAEVLWQVIVAGPAGRITGTGGNDRITVTGSRTGAGVTVYAGARNDTVTGGPGDDRLDGGSGNDLFRLSGGSDTIIGGSGQDGVEVTSTAGVLLDLRLSGAQSSGAGTVRLSGIESLTGGTGRDTLIGTAAGNALAGGDGDDRLDGQAGADRLSGGAGDDTLIGGDGADTLAGNAGNDLFIAGADDLVVEQDGEGRDTVESAQTHALMPNIEVLRLTGEAAINGTGNDLANLIEGNGAANRLEGGGGAGTLIGAAGDDIYDVDGRDTVIEAPGGGMDTMRSTANAVLPDWVEVLVLAGHGPMTGTGNALANRIEGNDDDNTLTGGAGADTLIGGLGNDTYLLGAGDAADRIVEAPGAGIDTINAAFSMVLAANLENLTLTGAGALSGAGNALDNRIWGNAAANRLTGGAGADTMNGGGGGDTYFADGDDLVFDTGADGVDTVFCTGSIDIGNGIKVLYLTGTAASVGRGNNLANRIFGNAAANLLDGRGGADTLGGGTGDDIYISDGRDVIMEAAGAGYDRVFSSGSIRLRANIEEVSLTGSAPISATGNAGANLILGNGAGNLLVGMGGADTLIGGGGNDTYRIDPADTVVEGAGEGRDVIEADFSVMLPAGVEVLVLTGARTISGTGNELHNLIRGNAAANRLTGGAGIDTLAGGAGNDTYISDGRDVIVETAAGGTDTVQTTASFHLPVWVEHLVAASGRGLALTGNNLANRITGGAGADLLSGLGAADTLAGGAGNDTYITDGQDRIIESAGQGIDTAISNGSCVLAAGVEYLTLVGAAVRGVGNALANRLTGNAAANLLDGGAGSDTLMGGAGADRLIGGTGDDTLFGGAGADRFVFSAGCGRDQIRDFQNGADRIEIASGAERFADLHIRQAGANAVVDFAGGSITLLNTRTGALDAGDFIFT